MDYHIWLDRLDRNNEAGVKGGQQTHKQGRGQGAACSLACLLIGEEP